MILFDGWPPEKSRKKCGWALYRIEEKYCHLSEVTDHIAPKTESIVGENSMESNML